jgi:pimeloyl-ACP methyl ester carboxylesterase
MTADQFVTLPSGIRLCYRIDGEHNARTLVMVAGLGLDLTSWPSSMVDDLVESGFRVIRFDNRDVGQSTHVDTAPPGRLRQLQRRSLPEDYDLGDMAEDTIGLLDALGVRSFDLLGMSMGGMIAQLVAARIPDRVTTLTSIFSTTGHRKVGQPATSTIVRMARRGPRTADEFVDRHLGTLRHIGSTTFPPDTELETEWARGIWERGGGRSRGAGLARQIAAIAKSGDRTEALRTIAAPTLVIHGDRDLMVNPSGGAATAAAITGSRSLTVTGMRHHLAPGVVPQLVTLIVEHTGVQRKADV